MDRPGTVYGVDGCRGGWLCAALETRADHEVPRLTFERFEGFDDCLAATDGHVLVIDIPIGLLDTAVAGGRPCDRMARTALGWPRRNSVFSPPARPALQAAEYREAIQLNGQGLSRQAFGILPKIGEVDAALAPSHQTRVFEGHPEMSFMRLAGEPLTAPKRKPAGRSRRKTLLESALGVPIDIDEVRTVLGRKNVAPDDLLDATVLAITGRTIRNRTALRAGAGERDSRGLEMAIWY